MKKQIELLAPGGDIDAMKTAILAGADAIYCGLDKFNARNRATNISKDDLLGIIRLAHQHKCKVFLTLNILILDNELAAVFKLLNSLVNTKIDGVIVQDFGMFYILSTYYPRLNIHASTQLTTHNEGQIKFLSQLTAERVNFSRELNSIEIKNLTEFAHANNVLTEVFVHGSYCISFSGICYMSSVHGGNSGNRGRCSQPCRAKYMQTSEGKEYPLNLKDNSAYSDLEKLYEAGVDSLKIEGRIKEYEYVYTVVKSWREQIDRLYAGESQHHDKTEFYKVFNRDFSNGFLKGEIGKEMFIDYPMSYSAQYYEMQNDPASILDGTNKQGDLYAEKEELRKEIKKQVKPFNSSKTPLSITVSGGQGLLMHISVDSPDKSFDVYSSLALMSEGVEEINENLIESRLRAIDDTEFFINELNIKLDSSLYLPYKELTSIKKKILYHLIGEKEFLSPINIPGLKKKVNQGSRANLSILLSEQSDVLIGKQAQVDVYFQLPDNLSASVDKLLVLFNENTHLIPWFPSVLIGDDYQSAIRFLKELKPNRIVSNNTGVAFEACRLGIEWIAGPYLNITNSYSLLCLKEKFKCSGSFLSNELNKQQILSVKRPEDFDLYYSIYHPVILMTSRQCLFQTVSGCTKNSMDHTCIEQCDKFDSITNTKNEQFNIVKIKGHYTALYDSVNLLNLDIVKDMPQLFKSFLIDLRDIKSDTSVVLDKPAIIDLFKKHVVGDMDCSVELKQKIHPTRNKQYKIGL